MSLTSVSHGSSQLSANEVMKVEFYDDDLIGDEFLGHLTFDIGAELRKLPPDCRNAEWHQAFPLDKASALRSIVMLYYSSVVCLESATPLLI